MALILDETFLLGIPTKTSQFDPYANNVVSLLRTDGAVDASTTATDYSPTPKTWTTANSATTKLSTTRSRYGSASFAFNISSLGGSYSTSVSGVPTLDISSGDFTIDMWICPTTMPNVDGMTYANLGSSTISALYQCRGSNTGLTVGWGLVLGTTQLYFYNADVSLLSGTHGCVVNKWTHIAVTRSGNVFRLFSDGNLIATATNSLTLDASQTTQYLGGGPGSGATAYYRGYIDEARVTKGVARWTASFTPPEPYTATNADPYYSNLGTYLRAGGANASTTFTDQSGVTWTPSSVTVSTAQSYRNTGSAQFSGATTSYLSAPASTNWDFGLMDFTIEASVYIAADSVQDGSGLRRAGICGPFASGTTFWNFIIDGDATTTGTGLFLENQIAGVSSLRGVTVSISKNSWHHLAVSRNSRGTFFSVDGVIYAANPIPANVNFASTSALNVGRGSGDSTFERPLNGYIEDFRITKGVARYVGKAYADTSNNGTALHLNGYGSNASTYIVDWSPSTKVLTAVGTAQNSSAQFKYGTTSLYIPGAGSYVTTPYHNDFNLGTGDFTFECWVWCPSAATYTNNQVSLLCVGRQDTTYNGGGYHFHLIDTNPLQVKVEWDGTEGNAIAYYGTIAATTVTRNTWHHIAVTRSSGVVYTFYDGVLMTASAGSVNTSLANATFNLPTNQNVLIGGSGTVAAINNWPMNGYIDDLRLTKGVARYTATFTPPTAELPIPNANDSYTAAALPEVYNLATFNANKANSGTLSTSYNSTYNSMDISTNASASMATELTCIFPSTKGEFEIDIEYLTDTGSKISGACLVSSTNNYYRLVHTRITTDNSVWYNQAPVGAWTWSTISSIPVSHANFAWDNVGDRRLLNVRWDASNYGSGATIEYRIDGVLVAANYGPVPSMFPAVFAYGNTSRLHSLKVWNAPTAPLLVNSTYGAGYVLGLKNLSMQSTQQLGYFTGRSFLSSLKNLSMQSTQQLGYFTGRGFAYKMGKYRILTAVPAGGGMSITTTSFGFRDSLYTTSMNYEIRGTIKAQTGATNVPLVRPLTLIEEASGNIVQKAKSDASGNYVFKHLSNAVKYTIIASDTDDIYRAVILDKYVIANNPTYYKNIQLLISGVKSTPSISNIIADKGLVEAFITNTSTSAILHGYSASDSGPKRLNVQTSPGYKFGSVAKFGSSSFRSDFSQWAKVYGPNGEFDFGVDPFNVEFNVMINSGTGSYGVLQYGGWGGPTSLGWLVYYSSNNLYFYASSDGVSWSIASGVVLKSAPTLAAWHHIMLQRQTTNGSISLWFDGTLINSNAGSGNFKASTNPADKYLTIGAGSVGNNAFDGWISEIIITKGTYKSANIDRTSPVMTYEQLVDPQYYSTELMLHGEDLLDSCSNTKLITTIGTVISTSEQMKIGNRSLYFDGASWMNAQCSSPITIGTGDFTFECWVNPQGTAGLSNIFGTFTTGASNGGAFRIQLNTIAKNGGVEFSLVGNGVAPLVASNYGNVGTWSHIAFSRNSGVLRVFVNGAMCGSVTHTSYIAGINNMAVGGDSLFNFGNPLYKGYIDELRFTTYGRYTRDFSLEYLPFLDHP